MQPTKSPKPPVVSELRSYYEDLIAKYLPEEICLWALLPSAVYSFNLEFSLLTLSATDIDLYVYA